MRIRSASRPPVQDCRRVRCSGARSPRPAGELLDELDDDQIGVLAKGLEVLEGMTKKLQERCI
ncbi:hypothetical protein AWC08_08775 [Mycobacterium gordonae]|uniref:Uncharacterized protein n=1 Tax=Mycobacterium gordonae TaxID=1778 RepID=A0A1X1VDZ3_MYCGO|nr:hypothetical protein AWC08_08775 [Mycobacterium gordonae]